MDEQPLVEDVLRELRARGLRCGVVSLCDGALGAWFEVDGTLDEGDHFVSDAPEGLEALNEIARWLKKTADRQERSRLSNVIDARRRFMRR